MLLSVTVVLSFDSSLLGTKSRSEWSVERKEVEGSKGRIGVFCDFLDHSYSTDKNTKGTDFLNPSSFQDRLYKLYDWLKKIMNFAFV